jgi:hypothetical protein
MTARARHVAAFLAMPVDPFAEHHRLEREWDARFDRLSQDHAAFRQRLDDACRRGLGEDR